MQVKEKNKLLIAWAIYSIYIVLGFSFVAILYMNDLALRNWLKDFMTILLVGGFFLLVLASLIKARKKLKVYLVAILGLVLTFSFVITVLVLLFIRALFHTPEHTTVLNNKKYTVEVDNFLEVRVDYYDYKGPFIRGNKRKVIAEFNNGGPDPFEKSYEGEVTYRFFDDNGNENSKEKAYFKAD